MSTKNRYLAEEEKACNIECHNQTRFLEDRARGHEYIERFKVCE